MQSYLLFTLHAARYAIPVGAVLEIIPLPELTPVAEAPWHIAGLLDLRGLILPVIDLATRLGGTRHRPRISDGVIVVKVGGTPFGLIVEGVTEVREIGGEPVDPIPSYGGEVEYGERFITAIARVDGTLVSVLGLDRVVNLVDDLPRPAPSEDGASLPFAPQSDPAEREVFRDRARSLLAVPDHEARAGGRPVALFVLGGEHFGMSLAPVREFAEIHAVALVPCAPPHIVGLTNLRGDILTLVDIRGALRMPMTRGGSYGRAIVVQIGEIRAGIIADEVIDVTDLLPEEIVPPPAALRSMGERYVTGVVTLGGRIFSMLDVARIFEEGGLVVEGQVAG